MLFDRLLHDEDLFTFFLFEPVIKTMKFMIKILSMFYSYFWLFSGYGTKTLPRAWEVSRSTNEKPHTDLSVFASHLHQHQCDQGLLPRGTRQTLSIRLEKFLSLLNARLCFRMENFTTVRQYYVTGSILASSRLWCMYESPCHGQSDIAKPPH